MPTATVPLSRPGAVKPAGVVKPAGFNRANIKDTTDDESEGKENPVLLILSIIACILALAFCIFQYQTDRILNRAAHEQRVFGTPGNEAVEEEEQDTSLDDSSESVDEDLEEE